MQPEYRRPFANVLLRSEWGTLYRESMSEITDEVALEEIAELDPPKEDEEDPPPWVQSP